MEEVLNRMLWDTILCKEEGGPRQDILIQENMFKALCKGIEKEKIRD